MTIMGIDPGLAATGYGFLLKKGNILSVIDYGVIKTPAGLSLEKRLCLVRDELMGLIEKYKPDQAAVESIFFAKNAKTAISVSHSRGVILMCLADKDIPIVSYTPLQIKQGVTGSGRADKKQIQNMVRLILGLETIPKPDDAADALSAAICLSQSSPVMREILKI